jgi:hypothetical protein
MGAQPNWPQLAKQLIVAVQSTEHAFERNRLRRQTNSGEEKRHISALRAERDRYVLTARRAIERATDPTNSGNIDWRSLTLDLLRTHSITWEILWLERETGVPLAIESGQRVKGRHSDADRYIDEAVQALAASEPHFNGVDWDGREVLRLRPRQP